MGKVFLCLFFSHLLKNDGIGGMLVPQIILVIAGFACMVSNKCNGREYVWYVILLTYLKTVIAITLMICVWSNIYLCCACSYGKRVKSVKSNFNLATVENYVQQMINTPVELFMSCECYHYYYTTRRDSHGHTHRTRHKRTTFRQTCRLTYASWMDGSAVPDFNQSKHNLIFLKTVIGVAEADPFTKNTLNQAFAEFSEAHRYRDSHFNSWRFHRVPGHIPSMTFPKNGVVPSMMNRDTFCMSILCCWAMCYIRYFNSYIDDACFILKKFISLDPNRFPKKLMQSGVVVL